MYETGAVVHAPKVSPKFPFSSFIKIPLESRKVGLKFPYFPYFGRKNRKNGENSLFPPYSGPKNSHISHIFLLIHQWAPWCTCPRIFDAGTYIRNDLTTLKKRVSGKPWVPQLGPQLGFLLGPSFFLDTHKIFIQMDAEVTRRFIGNKHAKNVWHLASTLGNIWRTWSKTTGGPPSCLGTAKTLGTQFGYIFGYIFG